MPIPLRALLVEDSEDDAILLARELRRTGYDLTFKRVDSPGDLGRALDNEQWDIIIADFRMPHFSGLDALDIVKSKGLDIPFIILSGVIIEELAIAAMRKGASDCIMKDNLPRLFPAIERELKEYDVRLDRKRAEEKLKESEVKYRKLYEKSKKAEELYSSLIKASPDAIIIYDLHGNVMYVSPSFTDTFGFKLSELEDEPDRFLADSERENITTVFKTILKKGLPYRDFETRFHTKKGTTLDVSISGSRYNDHQGKPAGMLAIIRDITEKKAMEAQLQQSQKMEAIGTLAGGIAHDFNNILGAMIGYTELATLDAEDGGEQQQNLDHVLAAGKRATDLVKHILSFSRQAEQKRRPLQIGIILKEALKLLRATLPTTIEIRRNIAESISAVNADPTQIHQVIINLCTNAFHAMGEKGGVLAVTLDEIEVNETDAKLMMGLSPGPYTRLIVSDNGHGIEPGILDKIFDPYFTTKDVGVGTGLGLSTVHGIVTGHGGRINVRSKLGTGSTFTIYLPSIQAETIQEDIREIQLLRGTEKILFVDDETALVQIGVQMLEILGYKVEGRTNSLEALELFRSDPTKYDLIITDYTMPNMTGFEFSKEILKIREDTPIILCTGFSANITQETAQQAGIREFLLKPLHFDRLAEVIRRVLDEDKNQAAQNDQG